MSKARMLLTSGLVSVLAMVGCALTMPGFLKVTALAEKPIATFEEPALVRITATSVAERRFTFGEGSSTCQLHLLVRVDGIDRRAVDERLCTADTRTHSLQPGESRTELLPWSGRVQMDDEIVDLHPGLYEVRGGAGFKGVSAPIAVMLEAGG